MGEEKEEVAPSSPEIKFEPVVKLEAVTTNNLEENEDEALQLKAKLYRYVVDLEDGPQWKERGVGVIKILKHKDTGKHRIIMRRDKTLKLCANHHITHTMELKPHASSEKAFVWNTMADLSDGEAKQETLAIRFRGTEDAIQFREKFEECVRLSTSVNKDNDEAKLPDLLSELKVKEGDDKESKTENSQESKGGEDTSISHGSVDRKVQEKTDLDSSQGKGDAPANKASEPSENSGET